MFPRKIAAVLVSLYLLVLLAALLLPINPSAPLCPLAAAHAQAEPDCLTQDATLTAQSLRIMQLEGTVTAYEHDAARRYTVGLIGYWELIDVNNPVQYNFRNDGFVQIDTGTSDATGVYTVHGDEVVMVLASTDANQPISTSLRILEMSANEIIIAFERAGGNLTFSARRITADRFSQVLNIAPTPVPTATPAPVPLLDIEPDDIVRFAITNRTNDEFLRLLRTPDDEWRVDAASSNSRADADTNQELARGIVRTFARLRALEQYRPDDVGLFGLDDPPFVMAVLDTDDQVYIVRVGSRNEAGTGYYATVGGDDATVYLLEAAVTEAFMALVTTPPYLRDE